MALVLGTNSGLVTSSPSADPNTGESTAYDYTAIAQKITVGADAISITEVGWWCDNATEEANFEVGIYSHNSGTDTPNSLLYSNTSNAKGTDAGWKKCTGLSGWNLDANTIYWVAVQLDNTATSTLINWDTTFTERISIDTSRSSLANPFVSAANLDNYGYALYAVYTTGGGGGGTNFKINIGDNWKTVTDVKVNIGDSWKTVTGAKINIGDTWKTIF